MAVIYLPVNSNEMRGFAASWNQGRVAKGKPPYQVIKARGSGVAKSIRRVGFGALRNVGAGTKVYILLHGIKSAHGVQPAHAVGARRGGVMKAYDPVSLARHLDEEGLTHHITDLRLFSCSAGIDVDAATRSFGFRFKQALTAAGFNAVTLSAYTGDLRSSYGPRGVTDGYAAHPHAPHLTQDFYKGAEVGGESLPASARRVQF